MGNLVFQATLGGQVNLVGPNTASTFNLNVPAVAGTLVTTGDTGTVTNTMCATSVYTAPGTIGSGTPNTGAFTTLSASGVASFAAGSASAPALTRTGDTNTGIFFPAADTIAFAEGGVESMRIDSSGNLGLGVTPSAWNSVYRSLQLGSTGAVSGRTDSNLLELSSNSYRNSGGGWTYLTTSSAARYDIASGVHNWYVAASGTAGNAITFTQAMTLTADNNLLIGATSQAYGSSGYKLGLQSGGSQTFLSIAKSGQTLDSGGMTIGLDASVSYLNVRESIPLTFGTANTERARIDSSGNLLVGATSSVGAGALGVQWSKDSNGGYGYIRSNLTTSYSHIVFYNPNGAVGSISTSGSSTTYATSSDYRLKDNVQPMTGALEKVAALKPVTYKWKVDGSDGEGFIAHELAEVCPDAVHGEKDGVDEDNNPVYQAIDTSFLVATLTAAIQELKAIVDAQAVEIAALKGQA